MAADAVTERMTDMRLESDERVPYTGNERLVIAIDLGTTHSAVSYSYMYPGTVPEVKLVNKWPGQPEALGDCKIPTLLAYEGSTLKACGAEALDYLGDDQFTMVKWFKLHLHPESMKINEDPPPYDATNPHVITSSSIEVPPLPLDVTIKSVYVDFLSYMYRHTREHFTNGAPAGSSIWTRLQDSDDIILVLATPNGWDASQQSFLKGAVMEAGLLTKSKIETNLCFVTEGEASVHYALAYSRGHRWLQPGIMFAVTDAGGSTVDSTLYACKAISPKLVLEEVCASECVQAGGVFVDRAAVTMLQNKLRGSRFDDSEYINIMVQEFERKTKRVFDGSQTSNVLQFGRSGDNDRAYGIIKGRLSLNKDEVAATYDSVISRIHESCLKLLGGRNVQHLLLVGGFGESPYLRRRLEEKYERNRTEIVTVEEPSKKAAAEGAVLWYIKQLVSARAARYTFGVRLEVPYNENNPEHRAREALSYIAANNVKEIDDSFSIWIRKDTVMSANMEKTFDYYEAYEELPTNLDCYTLPVYVWEGQGETRWCKDRTGKWLPEMRLLCTLTLDLTNLEKIARKGNKVGGGTYYHFPFQVALKFGGTSLQARLLWKEDGKRCEGPIGILPHATFDS